MPPMTGTVYLQTDRFEVMLEGITFKVKDFAPLCTMDFLFPKGKVWARPPVVGIDVLRHPRDPTVALLFLCFGIGCVIVRFRVSEALPDPILKFLQDDRIHFVGFGIPEKKDIFPFDDLGLKESKSDVGFLAARILNDPKLKKIELAELARRVLGINKMVGLTEAHSFGRKHQQVKITICECFISSVIAMALLDPKNEKNIADAEEKSFFSKSLEMPSLSTGGWSKLFPSNKEKKDPPIKKGSVDDCLASFSPTAKPVKGILKSPSNSPGSSPSSSHPLSGATSPATSNGTDSCRLKRANSKGHNVSFKEKNTIYIS